MKQGACFFLFLIFSYFAATNGQDRAPHGVANENTAALSPSAYEFFHPNSHQNSTKQDTSCSESDCSAPLPAVAAQVRASEDQESAVPASGGTHGGLGASGIIGIIFAFVFVVLLAMATYYIMATRRTNSHRTISVRSDV